MKIRNLAMLLFVICFTIIGTSTKAATPVIDNKARAQILNQRLIVIYELSNHDLTKPQKNELKSEVKHIQKELKTLEGGIYISVGAIIIILLLLIILL